MKMHGATIKISLTMFAEGSAVNGEGVCWCLHHAVC